LTDPLSGPPISPRRLEEWGEWVRDTLLLDVPHRQVVFTIPKTLRIFFKFRRRLLGELCRSAVKTLTVYFEALTGEELVPGVIAAVQTFGERINFHLICARCGSLAVLMAFMSARR
jgi:hypothetical protein